MPTPPIPIDRIVTIDFETYYSNDYSLRKLNTEAYIRDPRFEVIGVGVKVNDEPAVWMNRASFEVWLKRQDWGRTGILCHHTHFDGLILSHHFKVKPAFWLDTMSMARVLHPGVEVGGSLKALAAKYGAPPKGEAVHDFLGYRFADFSLEEWLRYGEYCKNDCDITLHIFKQMLRNRFPEGELWLIDTTIRMFTEPTFVADKAMLDAYLCEEQLRKSELLARAEAEKESLMSNDKFALILIELGVDPPRKVSAKTGKETWAFAKSDPGMQALLDHPNDEVRWLAEARIGLKSTINESRTARFLDSASRGRIPVYLKYGAAHTFRWGGADKLNFQNLERTNKKNPKKGRLRKSLLAPEGFELVVVDSAQIEARGVAWLADAEELVAAFAAGRDIYSEFASQIYNRHVDRKRKPTEAAYDADDEIRGFVGKVCILGLGYGMGWRKFAVTMLGGAMGGPPVVFTLADAAAMGIGREELEWFGINFEGDLDDIPSRLGRKDLVIHCAVSKAIVDKYRAINRPITNLWKLGEWVIEQMLFGNERNFGPGGCMKTVRHGVVLPSGLTLKYPGLELNRDSGDGYTYLTTKGGKSIFPTKLYGGLIIENITQALARQIVAEQILATRLNHDMHVVTTTHDEGVFLTPAESAETNYKLALAEFKVAPEWAKGWPLSAEGGHGVSYGGVK